MHVTGDFVLAEDVVKLYTRQVKDKFNAQFKVKDISPLHYCLGMSMQNFDEELIMHQTKYFLLLRCILLWNGS